MMNVELVCYLRLVCEENFYFHWNVFFFSALHELLSDNLSVGLADHTPNTCIVCTPEAFSEDEVSRCIDNRKKKPQCTQLSGAKKDNQIKTQIC